MLSKRVFLFTLLLFSYSLFADWKVEEEKIEYLLRTLGGSGLQFERNGSLHSGKEAEAHLRKKYESAKNSWFAPPQSDWTALLFIEKVGSKSSLSGSPYSVILSNGDKVTAENWFKQKLTERKVAK